MSKFIAVYGEQDRKVISVPFNSHALAEYWIMCHEDSEFMTVVEYDPEFTETMRETLKAKLVPIIREPQDTDEDYVGSTNNCGNLFTSDCFDLHFQNVSGCAVLTLTAYTETFAENCDQIYNKFDFGLSVADLVRNQGYFPNIRFYIFPDVSKRIQFITLDEFRKLYEH
jgi:hypothetical protein